MLELSSLKELCLQKALELSREPLQEQIGVARTVRAVGDAQAWQKWRPEQSEPGYAERRLRSGDEVILDFGTHLVGTLTLQLDAVGDEPYDAPLWMELYFAELFGELGKQAGDEHWKGTLAASWLPVETLRADDLPIMLTFSRRQAFRYVRLRVQSFSGCLRIREAWVNRESAVLEQEPPPLPDSIDDELRQIDDVGIATLRDCMQRVFEDGPKRDRRLWGGDLRLQALVNGVTFRDFDLVERSLYLMGAGAFEDGMIPGCVFDRPGPIEGSRVITYALLFGVILEEHLRFSGCDECVRALFPLSYHQLELVRKLLDEDRGFPVRIPHWPFVDHVTGLEPQAAFTGIYLKSLLAHSHLAESLGMPELAASLQAEWAVMKDYAYSDFYDSSVGLAICNGQVSYASQIWLALGGVWTPEKARWALTAVSQYPQALAPKTPYLWHYMLEACFGCGLEEEAWNLIRSYWGGMVRHGADTFWEAYVPDDPFFSPYGDFRLNSACHAWSCTPSYFIRTRLTN